MIPPPPALWSADCADLSLWVFATGEDAPLDLESARSLLTPEEHSRADRFHFPEDRARWMRSRACLRLCLGARLDADPRSLHFGAGPWGKPFLAGAHTGALEFNLSHSGEFAAVALSSRVVGVDIECWKNLPVEELATFAFRPEEYAAILAHAEPQRHFLELWTAKEAVMKCTGQGLSLPPDAVIVQLPMPGTAPAAKIDGEAGAFDLICESRIGQWFLTTAIHRQ